VCGAARESARMPNPWSALSVRARALLIGLALAAAILGPAITLIFARHRSDPVTSEIRVRRGR